jgi:hypothetical protein
MQTKNNYIAILILVCLGACDPQIPKAPDAFVPTTPTAYGTAKSLSNEEYNVLSSEQKYVVANKLMGTLYKGVPANDFFDLSTGLLPLKLKKDDNFLSGVQRSLSQPLTKSVRADSLLRIEERYTFNTRSKPMEYPLAMLFEFPISQDFLNRWVAYKLANTILFSPALENDSVDFPDIQDINYRLVKMMDEKKGIREIVYEHVVSQENWRRFRSPEDNVREMIEVFLGLFDRDADVPRGATACKNWYLTDGNQGYQLIIGFNENSEIQSVLDTGVINCHDFYRVLSNHPLLIPRITTVLVNTFFMGFPVDKNTAIVNAIVAANPKTFQDIFLMMLFSKEYLLNVERPKEFEETFFNVAARVYWEPYTRFFSNFADTNGESLFPTMKNMGQAPLTYKLGRFPEIPQDAVAFGFYHKAVREQLLIDRKTDPFNVNDGGWKTNFIDVRLVDNDFINYLFLSVVGRQAKAEELTVLNGLIKDRKFEDKKSEKAMIVLDYLSRLTETYNFKAVH